MPGAKSWSQAVQLEYFAVVVGGEREIFRHYWRVFALKTVQEVWTEWASVSNNRSGAASDGVRLIVAGSTTPSTDTPISDVYELNKDYDRWVRLPSMPKACMTCSAAIMKNKLYVMCNEAKKPYGTIIQVMNLEDKSWSEITLSSTIPGRLTSGSNKHCLAVLDDFIISDQLVAYDTASSRSKDLPSQPGSEPYANTNIGCRRWAITGIRGKHASCIWWGAHAQQWPSTMGQVAVNDDCSILSICRHCEWRRACLRRTWNLPLTSANSRMLLISNCSGPISKRHSFYTTTKTPSIAKWTRHFIFPDRTQRDTLLQTIKPGTFIHFDQRISCVPFSISLLCSVANSLVILLALLNSLYIFLSFFTRRTHASPFPLSSPVFPASISVYPAGGFLHPGT